MILTGFLESTFWGKNTKYLHSCAETAFNSRRVYHSDFNHEMPLRLSSPALRTDHRATTKMRLGTMGTRAALSLNRASYAL